MVVVGGGKSAIDNAVSAAKEGADVTLVCRKLGQTVAKVGYHTYHMIYWYRMKVYKALMACE